MRFAFTMAEILLSLTIIGVVAAITLPSLTGNINERTWNTQRKALYARMSQAIALMPSLNGYGTLTEGDSSTSAIDTAAETFITSGLSKVMKLNNICDSEHLEDCGISTKITTLNAENISTPTKMSELNSEMVNTNITDSTTGFPISHQQLDTKAAACETQNGESLIVYYNPKCISDIEISSGIIQMIQPKVCANIIYDLNGTKGPNTIGKDMGFLTILYSTDSSIVMPLPNLYDAGSASQPEASKLCTQQDSEYRLPNRDELAALFVNKRLINISTGRYWSSSVIDNNTAYIIGIEGGDRTHGERNQTRPIRCIRR